EDCSKRIAATAPEWVKQTLEAEKRRKQEEAEKSRQAAERVLADPNSTLKERFMAGFELTGQWFDANRFSITKSEEGIVVEFDSERSFKLFGGATHLPEYFATAAERIGCAQPITVSFRGQDPAPARMQPQPQRGGLQSVGELLKAGEFDNLAARLGS